MEFLISNIRDLRTTITEQEQTIHVLEQLLENQHGEELAKKNRIEELQQEIRGLEDLVEREGEQVKH
jgi:hypothetical protein